MIKLFCTRLHCFSRLHCHPRVGGDLVQIGILFSLFALIPSLAFALPADNQKPMNVTSNSFQGNYGTGIGVYLGDVVSIQGTRHLTADKLVVKRNSAGQITELRAYGRHGHLAHLITVPKVADKPVKGQAVQIVYQPQKDLVTFLSHAQITQNGRVYQGPKATYNTVTQIVSSPASPHGRTFMIIPPQTVNKGAKTT